MNNIWCYKVLNIQLIMYCFQKALFVEKSMIDLFAAFLSCYQVDALSVILVNAH